LTFKKARKRNPKLTPVEAKVLFIICKNGSPITCDEISAWHRKLFGDGRKREAGTIRGTVNKIKHLELATGRKYLHDSGGKPKTYAIDVEHCVNRKRTAVILLELDKGYERLGPEPPLDDEIGVEGFKQYISDTYTWDPSFTEGRLEYARKNDYLSFEELEAGKQSIKIEDRLDDDIEYLKLIVADYCWDPGPKLPPTAIGHLVELLSLYNPSATSARISGAE
jgi:hypothetical protein